MLCIYLPSQVYTRVGIQKHDEYSTLYHRKLGSDNKIPQEHSRLTISRIAIKYVFSYTYDGMMNWNLTSQHILTVLKRDGWVHIRTQGDHWQFKHAYKKGKVTVPHPKKSLAIKTIQSILKQAQLTSEEFETCLK